MKTGYVGFSPFAKSLAVICLCALAGCGGGGDDSPETGEVTGTVTLDGQPLSEATITFNPQGVRASTAVTDSSGKYDLIYIRDVKGAAIGNHQVSISKKVQPDGKVDGDGKETVPDKYNTKTTLTAEVKAGKNEFDFDLKSK